MSNLFGGYLTKKFTDVFPDFNSFKDDINDTTFANSISNTSLTTLYYLLYAEYGNSTIANTDETQFKYKVFANIFMYGPTWEKKLEYQKKIRELDDDELLQGAKSIYNHAYNPSTLPSTSSLEELSTINDQNTTNYKRSALDAYFQASQYLEQDFTKQFLQRFKPLFLFIVEPQTNLLYETDEEV